MPLIAAAHPFARGDVAVTLTAMNEYQLETTITAPGILPYEDDLPESGDPWEHHVRTSLLVNQNGIPCYFSMKHFVQDAERQTTNIDGTYQCAEKITDLSQFTIQSFLFGSQYEDPQIALIVAIDGTVHRMHFTRYKHQHPYDVPAESYGALAVIPEYISQGVAHILGGTDHVLFLVSLLVSTLSISAGLITITAFAIAHSITLFLAVYGIVSIDAGIVEPAIAITIFITALITAAAYALHTETLLEKARVPIVFLLGLVHGLGFGGDLSSIHLPAQTFLTAMLSFTAGIELGQIVMAVCILPLLYLLKKQSDRRAIIILVSCIIALVALYWSVSRLL
jgi:hypothetical protein